MRKILLVPTFSFIFILALIGVGIFSSLHVSQALGAGESPTYFKAITNSSALVTTSSTLVAPTSTAATYTRISNISGVAIYCSLTSASSTTPTPAVPYVGITIFASSSLALSPDQYNMYTGPIYCITPIGTASTTVYQH